MIQLNKNYSVTADNTHGFRLLFESDPFEKEITTKEGKEIKLITSKDTWYYPKLSQILTKFFSINVSSTSQEELLKRVIEIEKNISVFSKTFAKDGKVFEVINNKRKYLKQN